MYHPLKDTLHCLAATVHDCVQYFFGLLDYPRIIIIVLTAFYFLQTV